MSYTAVPTVATGDVWTASNHNLYIRDNFRAGIPDVITAKGDLVIGDGANALAILGIGVDGELLHGNLTWGRSINMLQMCDSSDKAKSYTDSGSGNIHIPTFFDVPGGANRIFCMIEVLEASTAYFSLIPSADTTLELMRIDAWGDTSYNQSHGIMPLDSTGGLYYTASDTSVGCNLYVYAWMY